MRLSALTIAAGDTSVNADDPASPARTASLTTRPSVESTFVVLKSVSRIGSRWLNRPAASSDPNGPMPNARMPMKPRDDRDERAERVHAAARGAVPAHMRRGLERHRRDRAVSVVVGVPPGVNVGVAVMARRVTRCT